MDIDTAKKSIAKYSEKTIKTAEKLYQKYYPFNEVIKIAIEKNEDLDVLKYLIEEKSCPVCPVDANRSRKEFRVNLAHGTYLFSPLKTGALIFCNGYWKTTSTTQMPVNLMIMIATQYCLKQCRIVILQ